MKKTNKLIIFLLSSIFVIIAALWSSVQGEAFGALSSNYIGKYVFKKYNVKLSFDKFNFTIIPLATSLINLNVENDDGRVELNELKISFGLRDLLSKNISIGELEFKNGLLISNLESKTKSSMKYENLSDLYKAVEVFYNENSPVKIRSIALTNLIVFHKEKVVDINKMRFVHFSDSFNIEGENILKKEMYQEYIPEVFNDINIDGVKYRLKLNKNGLNVETLILKNKSDYVSLSGTVESDKTIKKIFFDSTLDLENYKTEIATLLDDRSLNFTGQASIKGTLSGELSNLNATIDLDMLHFKSNFINIKKGSASILLKNKVLTIDKSNGVVGNGKFKLLEGFNFLDFNKDKMKINANMLVELDNIFSNDALVFVSALSDLDFYLSGKARIEIDTSRIKVDLNEDVIFRNLTFGKKRSNPLFKVESGTVLGKSSVMARFKGNTDIDLKVAFGSSVFESKGFINKEKININYTSTQFSFKELGAISGVALEGVGHVDGNVRGQIDDVVFRADLSKKNVSILGFKLNNVDAKIEYHLKNHELVIKKLIGKHNSLNYTTSGYFKFNDDEKFKLDIDIKKGRYNDLVEVLSPILKEVKIITDKFDFASYVRATASIYGAFDVSEISAKGQIRASELSVYGEDVEFIETPFTFDKNIAVFKDITGKKSSGIINADVSYNVKDKSYKYNALIESMKIRDFYYYRLSNLGLDGYLRFNSSGRGDDNSFSSKNSISIEDSKIDNVKINDSLITLHNNNKNIFFNGDFIGGEVKSRGFINLDTKSKKRSNLVLEADTKRMNEYLGILSVHNINKSNLAGVVSLKAEADFKLSDLSDFNFKAIISDAYFKYEDVVLKKNKDDLELLVENGKVKKWDIELMGNLASIKSHGQGRWGRDFDIETDFSLSASLFELLSDNIERARGRIKGIVKITEKENTLYPMATFLGSDMKVKLSQVRGLWDDGKFEAVIEENQLVLKNSTVTYGNGIIKTRGVMDLIIPFPSVKFESVLDKVALPILKKSNVTVSGSLKLAGERFPYSLSGSIDVDDGNILEGMQEIAESAATAEGYKRFLPVGYSKGGATPLLMNIDTKIKSPIIIKNGMIDIGLAGEVKIFGTPLSPSFNGDLNVVGQESKLIFKGHEFLLQGGEIRLLDNRSKEKPELDFTGIAKVNEYSIFVTINGAVDKLSIELNSNPSLSQGDIVSLLTLGVTSDVSKNLSEGEMQSVTSLSIGSLIVDQLKINQTLNDSLGLRLSVQPEFQENEDNLLGGRSEDTTSESRLKSTTRVKVYKKINKNVNMSVSSTLGGTVDQTQEMNINYKVNGNFSLEGIYQKQAGEEIDAETPDSIGADLKWQWFF